MSVYCVGFLLIASFSTLVTLIGSIVGQRLYWHIVGSSIVDLTSSVNRLSYWRVIVASLISTLLSVFYCVGLIVVH